MKNITIWRRWSAWLGFGALLLCVPFASNATPLMDGDKDAEYALVAASPKDDLLVDPSAIPPIDDPADPRFKSLDVTGLWAANTGSDLYLYIELPYYDPSTIAGEFAVIFHLGGANDAIERLGVAHDPYGAACDYGHTPAVNAVLKSNLLGFLRDYDGNQGYAFVNSTNKALTDWTWDNGMFLTSASIVADVPNNLLHGYGSGGGEIVYKGNKGIEIKIPLTMFATNPANTDMVPPSIGDVIKMQFYDNVRERTSPNYPRGVVDCVPFQAESRTDPLRGYLTTWASYTMVAPATLDVSGAQLKDLTDGSHIVVSFSAALGDGATTAANYTVVDQSTSATIPVTTAIIDPANSTKAILELALPTNTKLLVTVNNVKGANGVLITPTKNSAIANIGTAVQLNLFDPHGIMAAFGADPATSQPYALTWTGDPIGWRNDPDGATEIAMAPVAGDPGHFRSIPLIISTGVIGYKFRAPHIPNWDNWNTLNPNDRTYFVPAQPGIVQASENMAGPFAGTTYDGGPTLVKFTLVDRDNLANGRPVYITGTWTGWNGSSAGAIPMPAVVGQPNTYSATFTTPADNGVDITMKYKYLLIFDDPANPGTEKTEWDLLNPFGDHRGTFKSTGTAEPFAYQDVLGGLKPLRILRIAAGLDNGPTWSGYYADLDIDKSGSITVMDAVLAAKP